MNSELDTLVWFGRFQPFHNGHWRTLSRIIELSHGARIIVGVIVFAENPGQLAGPGDIRNGISSNPFSAYHRRAMLEHLLFSRGLADNIDVACLPRTDIYWPIASDMLPPQRIICFTSDRRDGGAFELGKIESYRRRGEKVMVIDVPEHEMQDGTAVREFLRNSDAKAHIPWEIRDYLTNNGLIPLSR